MNKKLLQQALEMSQHNIPYYAYGDNEAACQMALLLSHISELLAQVIAQPDHPTAAMQIAGGAVLLDYINENEAESEKRVGALTAARVFIAMQKANKSA